MEEIKRTERDKKGFGAFLNSYAPYFSAPLLVGILYLFALWQYGVYPFGTKYTVSSYDLSAQICPFIEHLFDVFKGKSTLSFSYAIVGGADVVGTFLYFFISPFSLLFLIFGEGNVVYASGIVMTCKLMAIAFAGTWFSKKLFQHIPNYLCVLVGVAYAYCGYTFVSNTYINWMDFLIYLPFCVGAFKHFVKTGVFWRFSILIACCIYTCFSIACFSMFTVFPALVAYGLLCVEKDKRNLFLGRLCIAFFVAIALALPVLIPALSAYSVSGRGGDLFENLWKGFSVSGITGEIADFDSSIFIDSFGDALYSKWSYILADSAFVVLTFVWFFKRGLKEGFSKFMLVAGALILLPTLVDESMNLLNMGSYMSYALRFGFLSSLYFLGGACLCLEGICYQPFTAYDGTPLLKADDDMRLPGLPQTMEGSGDEELLPKRKAEDLGAKTKTLFKKENRGALGYVIFFVIVSILILGVLLFVVWGGNYRKATAFFGVSAENFSSRFAHSLGGMEVVAILFALTAIVLLVGVILVGNKKISARFLSIVLVAVVGMQVFFYNGQLVKGNLSTQHETLGSYQVLNEELNRRDEGYFRVKDYNDKLTACAPLAGESNAFSVFSSVIDRDNFTLFQLFGYQGNGKNSFKSAHSGKANRSDEFGDAFLGYKYFITDGKKSQYTGIDVEDLSYMKPVYAQDKAGNTLYDEHGKEVRLTHGGLYVYENTIVFPLGYRVQSGGFSFVAENTNNKNNRKRNQRALYEYLRGERLNGEFITPQSAGELSTYLHGRAAQVEVSAGQITARVQAEQSEDLLLSFTAVKGYEVSVNGKRVELIDNDLKLLLVPLEEGENEVVLTYTSPHGREALFGALAGIVILVAVAIVVNKTKVVEGIAPALGWAGVALAVAVVAFFMIFPTGVFLAKLVELVKPLI